VPVPLLAAAHAPDGVRAVFSTRAGGVSAPPYAALNLGTHVGDDPARVAENRRRLAAAVGLSADRVAYMDQVHGSDVAVVDGPSPGAPPRVDALVTRTPGLALAVLVADCVPVLLADGPARVVAAVHAGRAGVALGVVPAALAAMRDLGARPERTVGWLGPAVGGCCYEVPETLQREVARAAPGTLATGGRTRAGAPSLDLRAGLDAVLREAGVSRVDRVGGCTVDEAASFSHRREGVTGRMAGVVWLVR
jgi:polyphenol oxidase